MPTYDYRCDANDRVIEVNHRMSESLSTWRELCDRAGVEPGDTPLESPVHRLANGGNIVSSNSLGSGAAPACSTGSCCPGGMCGIG